MEYKVYLDTIEGVPVVFCVTCNSLRESKVCELDNFSEVTMVETCVFVKATVTLLATSEV